MKAGHLPVKSYFAAWIRTVCIHDIARAHRGIPTLSPAEPENPIAHRLRPAGSGFQDFRTPAGARNSSGKRNDRS